MTSLQPRHEVTPANPTTGTPTVVNPEPDSRLDQLAAEYAALEPQVKENVARLEAIKTGIKSELAKAAQGQPEVLLTSSYLTKPLQMRHVESWRIDARRMKAEDPLTYVQWAVKSDRWELRQVS
jgi:hypothetical protein